MSTFITSWLPNIACLLVGAGIGWLIADLYARQAAKSDQEQIDLLKRILEAAEKIGSVKLERDPNGKISSGQVLTIDTASLGLKGYAPVITIGPTTPTARTEPSFASSPSAKDD